MYIQDTHTKQLSLFSEAEFWTDFEIKIFIEEFVIANLSLLDNKKQHPLTQSEVLNWVFSDENQGLSFQLCCSILELDQEAIRQYLKNKLS